MCLTSVSLVNGGRSDNSNGQEFADKSFSESYRMGNIEIRKIQITLKGNSLDIHSVVFIRSHIQ